MLTSITCYWFWTPMVCILEYDDLLSICTNSSASPIHSFETLMDGDYLILGTSSLSILGEIKCSMFSLSPSDKCLTLLFRFFCWTRIRLFWWLYRWGFLALGGMEMEPYLLGLSKLDCCSDTLSETMWCSSCAWCCCCSWIYSNRWRVWAFRWS